MSRAPVRLALFAALLLVAGLAAAGVGATVGPETETTGTPVPAHGGGGHAAAPAEHEEATTGPLPGLAIAADGARLVLEAPTATRSSRAPIRLRLVGDDGRDLRDLEVAHEKRLHLIVVRRDLTGFQHLHPEQQPDGTWTTTADLSAGGTYRVLADVTRGGEQQTLGADLHVAGAFRPVRLEAPAAAATSDRGLPVALRRDGDRVAFDVDAELQPYLGAQGHLVVLRAGDLAYLHAHPEDGALAFEAALPTAGTYRLWVQFQVDDEIHTAAFTEEVTR